MNAKNNTPSKVKKAQEIMLAFDFLGIPAARFSELKKEHGGLDGLHTFIGNQLA